MPGGLKTCSKCGVVKPFDDFYVRRWNGRQGCNSACKACDLLHKLDAYWSDPTTARKKARDVCVPNREKLNARQVERSWRNPTRTRFKNLRSGAKRRGHAFTLTEVHLGVLLQTSGATCPCCGSLYSPLEDHGQNKRSRSVDRLDSDLGYSIENCWVMCRRCNTIKQDATWRELQAVADATREEINRRLQQQSAHTDPQGPSSEPESFAP